MKKVMFLTMLATTLMMGACTSDDSWDDSWYGDDTSTEETRRTTAPELHAHTPLVYRQPGQDTGGEQKQSGSRPRDLSACGR